MRSIAIEGIILKYYCSSGSGELKCASTSWYWLLLIVICDCGAVKCEMWNWQWQHRRTQNPSSLLDQKTTRPEEVHHRHIHDHHWSLLNTHLLIFNIIMIMDYGDVLILRIRGQGPELSRFQEFKSGWGASDENRTTEQRTNSLLFFLPYSEIWKRNRNRSAMKMHVQQLLCWCCNVPWIVLMPLCYKLPYKCSISGRAIQSHIAFAFDDPWINILHFGFWMTCFLFFVKNNFSLPLRTSAETKSTSNFTNHKTGN